MLTPIEYNPSAGTDFLELYALFKKSEIKPNTRTRNNKYCHEKYRLEMMLRFLNSDDSRLKEVLNNIIYYYAPISSDSKFSAVGAIALDGYSGLILSIMLNNHEYFERILQAIMRHDNLDALTKRDPMGNNALLHALRADEFRDAAFRILVDCALLAKSDLALKAKVVKMITKLNHPPYCAASPLIIALAFYLANINTSIFEFLVNNPSFGNEIRHFIYQQNIQDFSFCVKFEMSWHKEIITFRPYREVEAQLSELIQQLKLEQPLPSRVSLRAGQ